MSLIGAFKLASERAHVALVRDVFNVYTLINSHMLGLIM